MVQINLALREVSCKVVYYGPGRSGKTTNLEMVHAKAPKDSVGELVSISTETDRTLFFDFLPLNLGSVAGMTTKFALYTVPGQVYYNRTRKLVLQGADGVVFVADSSAKMMQENIESLDNLAENLRENGLDIETLPLVLQWNKRDLPDAMPVAQMEQALNRWKSPTCEAVAFKGEGVFPALKLVAARVIKKLNEEYGHGRTGAAAAKPSASAAALPKPVPAPVSPPTPTPAAEAGKGARVVPAEPARQNVQIVMPAAQQAPPVQTAPKPAPQAPKAVLSAPPPAAVAKPAPAKPSVEPATAKAVPTGGGGEDNPIRREMERHKRAPGASEPGRPAPAEPKQRPAVMTIKSVQKGRRIPTWVWVVVAFLLIAALGVGFAWFMGLIKIPGLVKS